MTLRADCIDTDATPRKKIKNAPPKIGGRKKNKMTTAPQKNQKDAAQKSGRGRGAPLGNKNGLGNAAGKGKPKPGSGRHAKGAIFGDPRNIKINIAINSAEAAAIDAKAAAAGLSRADLIRSLISA